MAGYMHSLFYISEDCVHSLPEREDMMKKYERFIDYEHAKGEVPYEYSDKFNLSVIELNHIEMATDDDKLYGIDKWAKLFKAGTWEDIKMLAKNDECIDSAARGMFIKTQNDDVLKWCRKMDEEIAGDRRREQRMAEMTKKIEELEIIQRDAESKLVDTESKLVDTETKLVDAENQCTALARENCELAARIAELERQLAEQNK